MTTRRHFFTLLTASAVSCIATAQEPGRIYCGFPHGSYAQMAASVLADAVQRRFGRTYKAEPRAGNGQAIALAAFQKDPAVGNRLLIATPGPGQADLSNLTLLAVGVGLDKRYPEPLNLYVDNDFPQSQAAELLQVIDELRKNGKLPGFQS